MEGEITMTRTPYEKVPKKRFGPHFVTTNKGMPDSGTSLGKSDIDEFSYYWIAQQFGEEPGKRIIDVHDSSKTGLSYEEVSELASKALKKGYLRIK